MARQEDTLMLTRIFVSFDVDHDQDLCDEMIATSGNLGIFEVCGRSLDAAMHEPWKRKTHGQIAAADQVVVVCGEHTDDSERVEAEVRMAHEQDKPVILLWSRREAMCKRPAGSRNTDSMYSWTLDILRDQLLANQRKALPTRVPEALKRQSPPASKPRGGASQ
jgi:hypothetical protein